MVSSHQATLVERGKVQEDFETPEGEYISPSQIETWRLCKRKWAWGKLDRIEGVQNISAEKGTVIHSVLEAWLKDATPIDLDFEHTLADGTKFKPGPIVQAGLKHLPMPKTCGTERFIHVRTPVAKYIGYIDWDVPNEEIPIVGDHKSTGDFKWAKTEQDLIKDPQANIYAAAQMSETKKDMVELRWVYFRTRGAAKSKKVSLILHRKDVEATFDDLDVTAAEILHARRNYKTALELEPSPKACDAYGGCAHRERCNLTTTERIKAMISQESLADKMRAKFGTTQQKGEQDMGLLEKMAARKAAQDAEVKAAPEVKTAPTPAPEPAAPAKVEATQSLKEKLAAKKQGINAPEGSISKQELEPTPAAPAPAAAPAATPTTRKAAASAAAATTPATGSPALKNFTLYVDCLPTRIKGIAICVNSKTEEGQAALNSVAALAMEVIRVLPSE